MAERGERVGAEVGCLEAGGAGAGYAEDVLEVLWREVLGDCGKGRGWGGTTLFRVSRRP